MADVVAERAALEVFYRGWQNYQVQLAAAIAEIQDDQLWLRIAPNLRTAGEQLRHIVSVRAGWFHGDLREGGPEYDDIFERYDADARPQPGAEELRRDLDRTWRLIRECLDRWSPEDLTAPVTFEGPPGETVTTPRGWVVWHVLEHDLHHGGELGFLLGMHGLPAPKI